MQITYPAICDTSKGSNKPPLVGEHAFPLTEFVGLMAHATFCGSGGIISTARPEMSHPCTGFYRTQYPASYTHKSLGRTHQFTLPASAGTQMCLLCLSLKSQIPKLFRNDLGFPIFTGYL